MFRCVAKNSLGETDGKLRLHSKYSRPETTKRIISILDALTQTM